MLLDDSLLISKKTEPVNPKLVKLKSKSSLDTFQKLVAKEILIDSAAEALDGVWSWGTISDRKLWEERTKGGR